MPLLNYPSREITYKIVYYGTGLGGKTTNLRYIHGQLAPETRGELIVMSTDTERTLYFDFMSLDLGNTKGLKTKVALYTVPGQEEYNRSRKLILQGADGIVFVADSNHLRRDANIESLDNMINNLTEHRMKLENIPWVLQYNKRDLANAMPYQQLEKDLNRFSVPSFEAIALEGRAVFATLKAITRMVCQTEV
jgi:mutual gliding-motility protein MglA